MGWILYNDERKPVAKHYHFIKPDGWQVPSTDFHRNNGFDQLKSEKFGVPILNSLLLFLANMESCRYIISHNISFDIKVLGAEMIRAGLKSNNKPHLVCTKQRGTGFAKIPHANGGNGYKNI